MSMRGVWKKFISKLLSDDLEDFDDDFDPPHYEIDFNSFKEVPGCKNLTLSYNVIREGDYDIGVSVLVIPSKQIVEVFGNDFGRLTEYNRNYLRQQMENILRILC